MIPLDTSPAANEVQIRILRSIGGLQRLKVAIELSEFTRKLAFARIEQEHPGLTQPQLVHKFLQNVLPGAIPSLK